MYIYKVFPPFYREESVYLLILEQKSLITNWNLHGLLVFSSQVASTHLYNFLDTLGKVWQRNFH